MKSLEAGVISAINETGEKHAGKMEKGLKKVTELITPPEKINDIKVSLTEKLSIASDSIVEKLDKIGEGITNIDKGIAEFPGSISGLEQRVIERIADVSQAGIESDDSLKKDIGSISKDIETLSDKLIKSDEKAESSFSEVKTLLELHREKIETSEVTELNDQAISHFNNAEYKFAEKSLKKAIDIDESRAEIWTNLGQVQAAMEKWKDSEESFRKALQLDPELSPAMSGLGGLLVRTGRPDETIEFLRHFIENEQPAVWAMLTYSRALAAVNKHTEAVELLKKARELDPGNTEIEQEFRKYSDT
jgi:tetratricopeptide (TPR) repeat protein